jgi:hypothetical protein
MTKQIAKLESGFYFFEWQCGICMDSGIMKGLLGLDQCTACQSFLKPASARLFGAISLRLLKGQPIDDQLLNMGRALVMATAEAPLRGEALAQLLECPERKIKELAARLCEEWKVPAIASRQPPYGYFIADSAEQLLEWGRVTRSQAIRMLARYYHLFKATYPDLSGQQSLDFVNTVSTELQEAIR